MMTLRAAPTIALAATLLAAPLRAQEDAIPAPAAPLEALLEQLADPEAPDADRTAQRIVALWSQSGSDSMDLLLSRGRDAMEDEAFDKAVDHFTALVTLAPEFAEGWNARATAYFLDDEYWRSAADIARVLALEPRHFGALTGLSIILERTGDEAGALRAARAALAVNPHLDEATEMVKRLSPKVEGRDI
jgi:Flp pilus assembly protein TadD